LVNSETDPVVVFTLKMTGLKLPLPTSKKLPLLVRDKVKGSTMPVVVGGPMELNAPLAEIVNADKDPFKSPVLEATKTKFEEADATTASAGPFAANGEPGTDSTLPSERIVITSILPAPAKSEPMSVPIFGRG
jgi:hypothetical protein